jgi:hypothetical protein
MILHASSHTVARTLITQSHKHSSEARTLTACSIASAHIPWRRRYFLRIVARRRDFSGQGARRRDFSGHIPRWRYC